MWAFVLFDTLIFTGYFSVYLFHRGQRPQAFPQAQGQLDLRIGVFNTIVLLLSSWAVARCVEAARAGSFRQATSNAFLTVSFAVLFLVSKVFEWSKKSIWATGSAPASSSRTTSSSREYTSCTY